MKPLLNRPSRRPKQKSKHILFSAPWAVMRTNTDGRCALHAIAQVLRGRNLSLSYDPIIAGLQTFYPTIRERIDHLYRTGRFIYDQYDVSNPQVFHEFIKMTVPWVTHVVVLRESVLMRAQIRKGALSSAVLTAAALQQGYHRPYVNAVQKRTAAVFIYQPNHWIAAVPSEHNPCTRD